MFKFFRQIRHNLLAEGKITKYLKYAIGEIVLVVLGILIALSLNNWNQNRIENQVEKRLLKELFENLSLNENVLEASIQEEYKSITSIEAVLKVLENKLPYHDSMDYHFGRAEYSDDVVLSSTAFRSIESRGFDIVSSDRLRKSIITLFDSDYGFLFAQTIRLEDLFWPTAVLPMSHKHFRRISMKDDVFSDEFGLFPVDYNALLDDQQYHNIMKDRGHFRYQGAELKKNVLKKTVRLKNQIKDYLK